ncbi:hypothetical protein [Nocardia testacea]|uniref:Uncharacterized protein n=1 Tax=Nocardia testacea TaxID=248551 RepID=A0ABW7VX60_9NOCA
MSEGRPKAVGLIRRDVFGHGIDIHRVAAQFGYRIVWTLRLDTGPLASALILTEYAADAVVVPGFVHADAVRHTVTDLCALIAPMQIYPRGYRWPVVDVDRW